MTWINLFKKSTPNKLTSDSNNRQMTPSNPDRSKDQDPALLNYKGKDSKGNQNEKDKPYQKLSGNQDGFDGKRSSDDMTSDDAKTNSSKPVKNINKHDQKQAVDLIQMEPKLDQDDDDIETPQKNKGPLLNILVDWDAHESYDICEGMAQSHRGSREPLMSSDKEKYLTTAGSYGGGNASKKGPKSSSRTDGAESFTEDGDDDVFGDTGVQNEAEP